MSDDEDDYMSDKFLQADTKPGLMPDIFMKKHKRVENAKKKERQHKMPSLKAKEAEHREDKLNKALDESNKGFAMLSKMGFKKGMGLGKEGTGRAEPIPLEIRAGRSGLGKEEHDLQRKRQRVEVYARLSKKRREDEEHLRGDFKNRMRDKANEMRVNADLCKSRKACEQLDSSKGCDPPQFWYHPKPPPVKDENGEEIEDEPLDEPDIYNQLDVLTHYLRITHLYCIWCGTTFNDEDDLNSNCPGDTHEAHDDM